MDTSNKPPSPPPGQSFFEPTRTNVFESTRPNVWNDNDDQNNAPDLDELPLNPTNPIEKEDNQTDKKSGEDIIQPQNKTYNISEMHLIQNLIKDGGWNLASYDDGTYSLYNTDSQETIDLEVDSDVYNAILADSVLLDLLQNSDEFKNKKRKLEAQSAGGRQLNPSIFPNNTEMEEAFNNLNSKNQASILKLKPNQQISVMSEIMKRVKERQYTGGGNSGGSIVRSTIHTNKDPLTVAFHKLPTEQKFEALKEGYTSMANEFAILGNQKMSSGGASKITVVQGGSISDQIKKKYPLLAPQESNTQTTGNNSVDNNSSSSSNSNSNSSSSSSSGSSNTKTITF